MIEDDSVKFNEIRVFDFMYVIIYCHHFKVNFIINSANYYICVNVSKINVKKQIIHKGFHVLHQHSNDCHKKNK